MKRTLAPLAVFALTIVAGLAVVAAQNPPPPANVRNMKSFYDLKTKTLDGKPADLGMYKGQVSLVVNVASKCGFTPQYEGLEKLHRDLKGKGFNVLGFPSNDFGGQEPGSEAEIEAFCIKNYGITFPMMSKVEVKGPGKHPVYQWLTERRYNGKLDSEVTWNFQKFLIDHNIRKWFDPLYFL